MLGWESSSHTGTGGEQADSAAPPPLCFAGRRLLARCLPRRPRLGQGVARQGQGWPHRSQPTSRPCRLPPVLCPTATPSWAAAGGRGTVSAWGFFGSVGVNSGSGMSPLRYSMTWFILGLDLANGCEHKSPSFSTRHASSMLQFPCSLLSIVSIIDPFCQCSSTKSTNMNRSPCAFCLTGLCPQVISRRNVPNANTSVRGDGLPVRTNSGAR
uniref:Uncharacterized protein n=1 Tax=Oryza punctata TaxID=4537 RepID=A0A0E0LGW5_ORYPU